MDWDSEFSFSGETENSLRFSGRVEQLRRAMVNERRAAELLDFDTRTVEEVQGLLREQVHLLEGRRQEDRDIYQLDIDRVTYMLKTYCRIRLQKINEFHRHYNNADGVARVVMSAPEKRFAQKLDFLEEKHLKDCFLHCLPSEGQYQSVTKDHEMSMISEPSTDGFCFYRALCPVGAVAIEAGTITIEDKAVYLGKYAHVRNLLAQGKIELI